jgi:hypothetical protein
MGFGVEGSKREMVKMRRRRVLYWLVVRGIGRLVLGGCKIARNEDVEFGGSRSWVGTGMLDTGIVYETGTVGGIGGDVPRQHHLRTLVTLALTVSSVGFLEEVKARTCQRISSSSVKVSVFWSTQCPSNFS